jgi:hypothetical protein
LLNTALVLASDVANLKKPNNKDLALLRKWLEDDKLGGNFLKGTAALTWDAKHEGDFVVMSAPPPDNESLLPALSSLPLDIFHHCFGSKVREVLPRCNAALLITALCSSAAESLMKKLAYSSTITSTFDDSTSSL